MKRREFIGLAILGAVGAVIPVRGSGQDRVTAALARPRLLRVVANGGVVRGLGLRYRELCPGECESRTLAELIIAGLPLQFDPNRADHSLAVEVDDQVQRDFDAGRTVVVEGWILAVTEARQCALYSLELG